MDKPDRASLVTVVVVLVIGALIAWAGSIGGATLGGVPVFALAVAAAFAVQIIVYIPSAIAATERFFDLTGSLTFAAITVFMLIAAPAPDARAFVLAAMVIIWAVRLGSFLFIRIHRSGADDRFDEIKTKPFRFLRVWVIQGIWVAVTASAAWIAMGVNPDQQKPFGVLGIVGIVVWVAGFAFEVTADAQKNAFKADAANQGRFIRTGVWALSRHPNYFGEIMLWIGVIFVAAPVLVGWQWIGLLSPILVTLLLTRVSGIPLLEAKADKRWGGDADYQAYKSSTPVLIPLPSRRSRGER